MTDRPGWYVDPSGRTETYRWWDGAAWTRWLSDDAQAPKPDEPGPSTLASGDAFVTESDHDAPAIRLPAAVGITVGAVILALILLGVSVSVTSDRLPSGRAVEPPAKKEQPVVALFDETDQTYVAGPVRMKLPGEPYYCSDYPQTLRSGGENGFSCSVAVHKDFQPQHSWMADTGFGVLSDAQVVPDDLKATCEKVLGQLGTNGYDDIKLRDLKFKAEPLKITDAPDEAMKVTGSMSYRVKNLPATTSYLTFVVIKLKESGKHVVFYTDYPNTAPKAVVAAQEAALMSLTTR